MLKCRRVPNAVCKLGQNLDVNLGLDLKISKREPHEVSLFHPHTIWPTFPMNPQHGLVGNEHTSLIDLLSPI